MCRRTGGEGNNGEEAAQDCSEEKYARGKVEIGNAGEARLVKVPKDQETGKVRASRCTVVEDAPTGMTGTSESVARRCAVCVVLVGVLLLSRQGRATTVVAQSFESICHAADMVFVGTVNRIESRWAAPEQGTIETVVTFSDLLPLFGVDGNEVELTFAGGAVDGMREEIAGVPQFEVGDRVVVFARHGHLVSPIVGFHQGLFRVVAGDKGPVVLNEERLPVIAVEGPSLRLGSTAQGARSAMPLDAFLGRVREILATRPDTP